MIHYFSSTKHTKRTVSTAVKHWKESDHQNLRGWHAGPQCKLDGMSPQGQHIRHQLVADETCGNTTPKWIQIKVHNCHVHQMAIFQCVASFLLASQQMVMASCVKNKRRQWLLLVLNSGQHHVCQTPGGKFLTVEVRRNSTQQHISVSDYRGHYNFPTVCPLHYPWYCHTLKSVRKHY